MDGIKTTERQLAYMIKIINSLFSYGFPSANNKFKTVRTKRLDSNGEVTMEETNVPKTREEHLDFRIGALIINLIKLTVLVKQRD